MSAIDEKHAELGGESGFLGAPITPETPTPDGRGRFRHFQTGSIYWSPETGAHEVHGGIRRKWSELGWERGFLGYPTTDETMPPDGRGRFSHFQGGSIYWSPEIGAWEVHGAIRRKWSQLGWERSFLGYPVADETPTPDGRGRFSHFQTGSIYWTPETGAWEVHGGIRRKWSELGWERGFLGYPTTDELQTVDGVGRWQRFQHGIMYWNPTNGVRVERAPDVVHHPWALVRCKFRDVPGEPGPSDFPFLDYISENGVGKGGLYEYWRDVTYGQIDLFGSAVLGWYTMKYSFAHDAANPLPGQHPRNAWITEARRLAKEDGYDLSRHKVIALVNASADDSSNGNDFALTISGPWGERNWKWCRKCMGLAFASDVPGICPAGDRHDHSQSTNYILALNLHDYPGQANWRKCSKCMGLAFAGDAPGVCPAAAEHDFTGSGNYRLATGASGFGWPRQDGWRWCQKCQGLAHTGAPGICPVGGGEHTHTGTFNYTLVVSENHLDVTYAAHEMGHGYGLDHSNSILDPKEDYGDRWCLMGSGWTYNGTIFGRSGSGLCAPQLNKLGCLPDQRVWRFPEDVDPTASGSTITLAALNRPDVEGFLMAEIRLSERTYTVEFRQKTAWDRGLPEDGIIIHELRPGDNRPYMIPANDDRTMQHKWAWQSRKRYILPPTSEFREFGIAVESIDSASSSAIVSIGPGIGGGLFV